MVRLQRLHEAFLHQVRRQFSIPRALTRKADEGIQMLKERVGAHVLSIRATASKKHPVTHFQLMRVQQ